MLSILLTGWVTSLSWVRSLCLVSPYNMLSSMFKRMLVKDWLVIRVSMNPETHLKKLYIAKIEKKSCLARRFEIFCYLKNVSLEPWTKINASSISKGPPTLTRRSANFTSHMTILVCIFKESLFVVKPKWFQIRIWLVFVKPKWFYWF